MPLPSLSPPPAGYAHPAYAESLAEFGQPLRLAASGAWGLVRPIPDSAWHDGMGCYPLLVCQDWSRLGEDLTALDRELVSFSAVIDPLSGLGETDLRGVFQRVLPFKTHFLVEMAGDWPASVTKHHRYYARRAAQQVTVQRAAVPSDLLDPWCGLYGHLVDRHGITGMRAFSRQAFARQLTVPGLTAYGAWLDGALVAAHLWYLQGDVAYSHLAASSDTGYQAMAAYALYEHALQDFSSQVRWVNLGAGAGTAATEDDGLARFKRGWATTSRTAFFCGRIGDADRFADLAGRRGTTADEAYFPAYRRGEFG